MADDLSDTPELQQSLASALGALVINVAGMEESLHDAIWLVAGAENPSIHVLTAGLPFRTLVEKFGALCAELQTARVPMADVKSYCDHLNRLNDQRNTIIHSAWNVRAHRNELRRFKRSAKVISGFSLNVTVVTVKEIEYLAEQFRLAEQKLWELVP